MGLKYNPATGKIEIVPSEVDFGIDSMPEQQPYSELTMPDTSASSMLELSKKEGFGGDTSIPTPPPKTPSSKNAALAMQGTQTALQAFQMIQQARQQERMNKYNQEVEKYRAKQAALAQLAQIGQNLRL